MILACDRLHQRVSHCVASSGDLTTDAAFRPLFPVRPRSDPNDSGHPSRWGEPGLDSFHRLVVGRVADGGSKVFVVAGWGSLYYLVKGFDPWPSDPAFVLLASL